MPIRNSVKPRQGSRGIQDTEVRPLKGSGTEATGRTSHHPAPGLGALPILCEWRHDTSHVVAFTLFARLVLLLLLPSLTCGCLTFGRRPEPASPSRRVPGMWPVTHERLRVSSPFGYRNGRLHKGIDLAVPVGTPAHATADGRVRFSGRQRGYGEMVIIDHAGGFTTVYAHLRKRLVNAGDAVARGQTIGLTGRSGNATGPHLHYEIRRDGRSEDPAPYLP